MKIVGIKSGALLQRDTETEACKVRLYCEFDGMPHISYGALENESEGIWILKDIPVGGPYKIEISDNTSKQTFTNLFVGDLWILAGQSNMEGAGCETEKTDYESKNASDSIRCYYLDGRWDKAVPVTHEPWLSPDECIGGAWKKYRKESVWKTENPGVYNGQKVRERAVGPGYYFAKRMYEITGIPQAVVACAKGGASLDEWSKSTEGGLYSVMLRRFRETGSCVRGIFWDQGESEAHAGNDFTGKMLRFVSDIREDMNNSMLPFVQVQIAKYAFAGYNNPESGIEWSRIKEEQRLLEYKIPFLTTVSAADADYDDLIHYSSEFQEKMGVRGANAMAKLIGAGGADVPVPYKITYRKNEMYSPFFYIYDIHYKNVNNLMSDGRPSGFMVLFPDCNDFTKIFDPHFGVQKISLNKNTVTLYTEVKENPEEAMICYGFGHMAYCNITTDTGFSIPAMGPIKVKEMYES